MKFWRQALLGLVALSLAPTLFAANPCESGGSPIMRDGTGQGGTGLSPYKPSGGDGSGSGGTGHTVEVEGVITGFASICVNGLELHYLPTTPVMIQGKSGSPKDLRIGQVVRARAQGQGNQLSVQRLHVRHLLVSPLQQVGVGELRAQGRNISLSPNAVLPTGLVPGTKVAVSGFVGMHGRVVATRLDVVPDDTPDSLTGEVQRNTEGDLAVEGVVLKGHLPKLEPGEVIRAEGHYEQGRMQVIRFEREEHAMPVDRFVVQGLIGRADKSGISINGQRFLLDSQTRIKQALPRAGEWAIIDAVRAGGQFRAREIDARPFPGNNLDKPPQEGDLPSKHSSRDVKDLPYEPESGTESGTGLSGRNDPAQPEMHDSKPPSELPEKHEVPEKIEHLEKMERVETVEHPEKIERVEPIERPEKIERVEAIERPEKIERVERVERVEKIERPEKVERVERVERIERPELEN